MCFYVRIVRHVSHNLVRRLCSDLADWFILNKRRLRYSILRLFTRYDDVGPSDTITREVACDQTNIACGLESKPWFHNIDRKKAQDLVTAGGNGCFVVRLSSSHPLTLTLFLGSRTFNVPIRKREDGQIALGIRKQNERTFPRVEDVINYYEKEELVLFSAGERAGQTVLKSTPAKITSVKEGKNSKSLDIFVVQ